jgi:hypothetical protein
MNDIISVLRLKEEQLKLLTKQVEALRLAAHLMAEENPSAQGVSTDKGITQLEMIRVILSEKGEPMHVGKIAEAIRKKYNKKMKPMYITSLIYRPMKKGKLFYKAPNSTGTFGLIDWQLKMLQMPTNIEVKAATRT